MELMGVNIKRTEIVNFVKKSPNFQILALELK